MSEHTHQQHHHHGHVHADDDDHIHFLDNWGTAVVIVYGLIFLAALVSFAPRW